MFFVWDVRSLKSVRHAPSSWGISLFLTLIAGFLRFIHLLHLRVWRAISDHNLSNLDFVFFSHLTHGVEFGNIYQQVIWTILTCSRGSHYAAVGSLNNQNNVILQILHIFLTICVHLYQLLLQHVIKFLQIRVRKQLLSELLCCFEAVLHETTLLFLELFLIFQLCHTGVSLVN